MRSGDWPNVAADFFYTIDRQSARDYRLSIQSTGQAYDSSQPPSKRLSSHSFILDAILDVKQPIYIVAAFWVGIPYTSVRSEPPDVCECLQTRVLSALGAAVVLQSIAWLRGHTCPRVPNVGMFFFGNPGFVAKSSVTSHYDAPILRCTKLIVGEPHMAVS